MDQLTRRLRSLLVVVGVLGGLFGSAGSGLAQTQTCQFTISAPGPLTTGITISQQGVHCLMTDVNMAASFTSGNAIEIAANNVIFDLNGHKLGGLAAGPGTLAIGIHAFQRKNITIKNGTVRGFNRGIFLEDVSPFTTSQGHRVEGVRAEGNTVFGILVQGQGSVVRGNQVVDTGGASFATPNFGIFAAGPGARILDNDVIETAAASGGFGAFGIALLAAPSSVVEGNRVGNQIPPGVSEGIHVTGTSTNVLVVGNRVLGWPTGVAVSGGGSAKCRDNFFANVTTPLAFCTDVANNN